ncbi:hypothetical protein BC829DRAFT_15106 [Chytridium lagenaria]|nr:hypothetical protein BC829DRAFT_15106 [Chytridium lagenaria]
MAQIRVCNVSSLFALFLLAALLLGVTGLDLFLRILRLRPVDLATRYVFTVGGAMVMLFGGALFIVSARKISNQASLLDIPKLYVPINQSDLPKTVHRYIQSELSKAASIRSLAKPSDQDRRMNGWGKVGSAQHPVHFRTAACQTMEIKMQQFSLILHSGGIHA